MIEITQVQNIFPKKTNRSNRLQKKMHIGVHAETLIDISIVFDKIESKPEDPYQFHDDIIDALCERNIQFETLCLSLPRPMFTLCTSMTELNVMTCVPTHIFSTEEVIKVVGDISDAVSGIIPSIKNPNKVTVVCGDAYYGDWQ